MATLLQDIKIQSDWIVKAFAADKLNLDYTIRSFIEIDKFFTKHAKDGKAVRGGRLSLNFGPIIFSIGSYVGQTIIRNVNGAYWEIDDEDVEDELNVSVKLPDGSQIFPIHRILKRFQDGPEDAIYTYGYYITKDFINESFDESFWKIGLEEPDTNKAWWRFW